MRKVQNKKASRDSYRENINKVSVGKTLFELIKLIQEVQRNTKQQS